MDEDPVRLLALWHARRRDLDELLEPLLAQGPLAVERVAVHLADVSAAVAGERAAYDAFLATQGAQAPQRQAWADRAAVDLLLHVDDGPADAPEVDERFARAREQALASTHPSGRNGPPRDDVVVELGPRLQDDGPG